MYLSNVVGITPGSYTQARTSIQVPSLTQACSKDSFSSEEFEFMRNLPAKIWMMHGKQTLIETFDAKIENDLEFRNRVKSKSEENQGMTAVHLRK